MGQRVEYNDYISIVRRWLKNYNFFLAQLKTLTDEIEFKRRMLDKGVAAPIANYSGMPRSGPSELNNIEMAAQDRMDCQKEIYWMLINRDNIQHHINQIDSAIAALLEDEQDAVKSHFFKGESWERIGSRWGYTESWARSKGGKAVKKIAFILQGSKVKPADHVNFVFAL